MNTRSGLGLTLIGVAMLPLGVLLLALAMDWTKPHYLTPIAWRLGAALLSGGLVVAGTGMTKLARSHPRPRS